MHHTQALLCAAVLVTTGCTSPAGDAAPERPTPPSVTLSFTQLLPEEGTENGLLRVVNTAGADLHVTGIGLDWPGVGGAFMQEKDSILMPEQTMDLKITLPPPDCDDDSAPVVGMVESGDAAVRQELVDSGQVFVRRLWALQCSALFVSDRLGIEYGRRWHRLGSGAGSTIVGSLDLTRREGNEPIHLLGVQGSVLYDLALPGARGLAAGVLSGSLPIEVLPGNRCDEHARGQATAPFTFRLELKIGDSRPHKVLIEPPLSGQTEATALLDRACG